MSAVRLESTLLRRVERHVETSAASNRSLVSGARGGWESAIDSLLAWWEDPARAGDEDGFVGPSREIIQVALQLASVCRANFLSPPLRVVPDGEGGIAFERRAGHEFESLRVAADGRVELLVFENSRLVHREQQQ